jgi:hypothetical protein
VYFEYAHAECPRWKGQYSGGHSAGKFKAKKLNFYMCSIPNGFRNTGISQYSYKLLKRKRYYAQYYFSSFKFGTVHPVLYVLENSTVKISALCNLCVRVCVCVCVLLICAVCGEITVSETVRNWAHADNTYIFFYNDQCCDIPEYRVFFPG